MIGMLWLFQGHVVMGTQAVSPYQQVIEKTKALSFKSQVLVKSIDKKLGKQDVSVTLMLIISY